MKTIAEVRVEPMGAETSHRAGIEQACSILMQGGLECRVHEMGTNVEGELERVLEAVRAIHEALHAQGVSRISTRLDIETRTDRSRRLEGMARFEVDDLDGPAPRLA